MKINKKYNIYIDYEIPNFTKYLGNSFPPLIYKYFKKSNNFNIYSLSDKHIPKIDFCIVLNGGSHWTYKNLNISNFSMMQFLIWVFPKFHKFILFFFYIFKFPSHYIFKRHLFPNISYEKHLKNLIKNNPNMKIIHRLDGIYQVICKVYGYDFTIKKINQMSDLTIYQSQYSKNSWEKGQKTIFGKTVTIKPKRSLILNNGVDTNIFNISGKKLKLNGKWKILNISASPSPKKGLFRILELADSLKNNDDYLFYLIGNQDKDPMFGKYLKDYKNIIHLGIIKNRDKLSQYFRSCDIFMFPSEDDCSPNVILEAMASGLPVLTVNSGGINEIIDKDGIKSGLFIDDKNPVMNLLNIIKFYDQFRFNSLEIIKKFHNNDNIGLEYEKAIQNLELKN